MVTRGKFMKEEAVEEVDMADEISSGKYKRVDEIKYRHVAKQLVLTEGMTWKKPSREKPINPIDIDAFNSERDEDDYGKLLGMDISKGTRGIIFYEVKHKTTPMSGGQKTFLESVCNAFKEEVPYIVLHVSHDIEAKKDMIGDDISLRTCKVVSKYFKGKWTDAVSDMNAEEATEWFIKTYAPHYKKVVQNETTKEWEEVGNE